MENLMHHMNVYFNIIYHVDVYFNTNFV